MGSSVLDDVSKRQSPSPIQIIAPLPQIFECIIRNENMSEQELVHCNCPYCESDNTEIWAMEKGFTTVRCVACEFLYLCPRPSLETRDKATELGLHSSANNMNIAERFVPPKIAAYRKILAEEFSDIWQAKRPIAWLDIGAGYGEFMEAVGSLAPEGSKIIGLEPMKLKAEAATQRGLLILQSFIDPDTPKANYISLINVFSHVYDFDDLLCDIHSVLLPRGELFIETGDVSGLKSREDFPGELGSPDHVAFAGQTHITGFLERNGFEIIKMRRDQIDGYLFTAKNVVKKILGRNVKMMWPNSSPYRTLFVRARKLN